MGSYNLLHKVQPPNFHWVLWKMAALGLSLRSSLQFVKDLGSILLGMYAFHVMLLNLFA